uniref:Uncharacterized protein n=1 Tax=viral metagenome TaxID=1070528 RepID=A0A6C0EJ54_9ZZZZ|tara:strand:- start:10 stop:414 length:405 start_codon:yes stop_codon:yes gene_type:complete
MDMENFKDLHQQNISYDDFTILCDFYSCVKKGGKYKKMIAFIYEKRKDSKCNIISNFADLIGETNFTEINNFKLYDKRPELIIIPERCKGKNRKINGIVRNLIFYEQPILYGGKFIKGVFNKDILDKTHTIYVN